MVLLWAFCFTCAYLINPQIHCVSPTRQVLWCWAEIILTKGKLFVKTMGIRKFSRLKCQVDKHITVNRICIPCLVQLSFPK